METHTREQADYAHTPQHVITWPNGESYEGWFCDGLRHGEGTYFWPGGSRFKGKFNRNQKEGFGTHYFPDGTTFQGQYHRDQRSGPGVITYLDGRQDVGLWQGNRLLRLCSPLTSDFQLSDKAPVVDHDEHPHEDGDQQKIDRSEITTVDVDISEALKSSSRLCFGPKGPLEESSERLIQEASIKNLAAVQEILREGKVHPDVCDGTGHTALIAATLNFDQEMIHLLLDSGANVDKLNDKGMSALAICHLLSYPVESLKVTEAEREPMSREKTLVEYVLISKTATSIHSLNTNPEDISENITIVPQTSMEDSIHSQAQKSWETLELLLRRGADPNASSVPMPVIFMAIKAGLEHGVRRLLECGARTDVPMPGKKKLYPLHIAAGLPGPEGPLMTQMLLHGLADPDTKANDEDEVFHLDLNSTSTEQEDASLTRNLDKPNRYYHPPKEVPEEGGRTALHVACQRETDHTNARDVVAILLSHRANPNFLWSGHSPLSLAVATGNVPAVEVLLAAGADPNLPLTRGVRSALCAAVNIRYNVQQHPRSRIELVEKLLKAGANILMPVPVGSDGRSGTAVDFAHYSFLQNERISHTAYHALNPSEREMYNTWQELLALMGGRLREAAVRLELERQEAERAENIYSVGPSGKFEYCSTKNQASTQSNQDPEMDLETYKQKRRPNLITYTRDPMFSYCYNCGRSVGVALVPCSRCHEVFFCSNVCKKKSWNERHKDECVRLSPDDLPYRRKDMVIRNKTAAYSTGKTAAYSTGKTDANSTDETDANNTGKTEAYSTGKTDANSTDETDANNTGKTDAYHTGKTDAYSTGVKGSTEVSQKLPYPTENYSFI